MEDKNIVTLFLDRKERAIEETKHKYGKYCNLIAYNILKTYEDAEECEHDTYLKAWNTIPPTVPISLKAYLGRIARNLAIGKYRYYHADKRNQHVECVIEELEECIAAKETVESELDAKELARCIDQFLEALDAESRMLFVRRYWKSESIAEICSAMHITKAKAETKLFRVRQKLKLHLEQEGYNL